MGMCPDCPRIANHTCGPSRCCMDRNPTLFVADYESEGRQAKAKFERAPKRRGYEKTKSAALVRLLSK